MAQMLKYTSILYHMPPDEVMAKPKGTRAFMFVCALEAIEEGLIGFRCPFTKG